MVRTRPRPHRQLTYVRPTPPHEIAMPAAIHGRQRGPRADARAHQRVPDDRHPAVLLSRTGARRIDHNATRPRTWRPGLMQPIASHRPASLSVSDQSAYGLRQTPQSVHRRHPRHSAHRRRLRGQAGISSRTRPGCPPPETRTRTAAGTRRSARRYAPAGRSASTCDVVSARARPRRVRGSRSGRPADTCPKAKGHDSSSSPI